MSRNWSPARIAEGKVAADHIEIVRAERNDMRQRDGVVGVDESVDLGQGAAGKNVLDQPLDRGAIAGLLDAEGAISLPPRRDPRDFGQFRSTPASRGMRLAIRDEGGERSGTFKPHVDVRRDDHGHANSGKFGTTSEMSMRIGRVDEVLCRLRAGPDQLDDPPWAMSGSTCCSTPCKMSSRQIDPLGRDCLPDRPCKPFGRRPPRLHRTCPNALENARGVSEEPSGGARARQRSPPRDRRAVARRAPRSLRGRGDHSPYLARSRPP